MSLMYSTVHGSISSTLMEKRYCHQHTTTGSWGNYSSVGDLHAPSSEPDSSDQQNRSGCWVTMFRAPRKSQPTTAWAAPESRLSPRKGTVIILAEQQEPAASPKGCGLAAVHAGTHDCPAPDTRLCFQQQGSPFSDCKFPY